MYAFLPVVFLKEYKTNKTAISYRYSRIFCNFVDIKVNVYDR